MTEKYEETFNGIYCPIWILQLLKKRWERHQSLSFFTVEKGKDLLINI